MLKIHNPKIRQKNETAFVQEEEQAEFPMELFQLMQTKDNLELEDRGILFINTVITKHTLDRASKALLSLHFNPNFTETIQIIINSPGGYTDAGWAFIDMMDFVKNDIKTIAVGEIASMATSIFISGDERVMSANSVAMIHEFSTGSSGNYSELVASRKAEDMEYQKDLNHLLKHSRYTTQTQITANLLKETDNWLTPTEMKYHGLCDEIIESESRKEKKITRKRATKKDVIKKAAKKKVTKKKTAKKKVTKKATKKK